MTSISITLIRGTHSEFNIDDPEAIQIIKLNKQEIACIDNLEVFSHIRELHLADNLIERIENINFLQNLTFLDLSNNRINSESLLLSIGSIPRNLKDLNLSGNQCAEDESALNALQDGYPDLNIIVGVYVGGEIIESFDGLGFENSRIENPTDSDEDNDSSDDEGEEGDMPLNADEVLKSLVERKCRLQSMETFSVERTTEVLYLILTDSVTINQALILLASNMKPRLMCSSAIHHLQFVDFNCPNIYYSLGVEL